MSVPLEEALEQVELEAGRVYRCRVKGRLVELRVVDVAELAPSTRYDEEDVMLDPWVELPRPTSAIRVRPRVGTLPPPDIPPIPSDEDEAP